MFGIKYVYCHQDRGSRVRCYTAHLSSVNHSVRKENCENLSTVYSEDSVHTLVLVYKKNISAVSEHKVLGHMVVS